MDGPSIQARQARRRPFGTGGHGRVDYLTRPETVRRVFRGVFPELASPYALEHEARVLKRRLGSRQVLSYSIGVSHSDGRRELHDWIVKRYASSDEGAHVFRTMRALWAAGFDEEASNTVSRPLAWLNGWNLLVQERARGTCLKELMRAEGIDSPPVRAAMASAGRWLAKLHAGPRTALLQDARPRHTSMTEIVGGLRSAEPAHAETIRRIAEQISRRLQAERDDHRTTVHGDFHPENIFLDTNRITVIDLDNVEEGCPAADLAYFIGQVRVSAFRTLGSFEAANAGLRAFLDGYWPRSLRMCGEATTRRVPALAARATLEIQYYIRCVCDDPDPRLFEALMRETRRLVSTPTIAEVSS